MFFVFSEKHEKWKVMICYTDLNVTSLILVAYAYSIDYFPADRQPSRQRLRDLYSHDKLISQVITQAE